MIAQEEAVQILGDVLHALTSSKHDLKVILRQCQHVCTLIGWKDALAWFQRELTGYPQDAALPLYRFVNGKVDWVLQGSIYEISTWAAETMINRPPDEDAILPPTLEVRTDIDTLLAAAQGGYREHTPQTKQQWSKKLGRAVTLVAVKDYPAFSFAGCVATIESHTFNWASNAYVVLRHGNVLGEIWADYRKQVDASLGSLGFANHMEAINRGIQSDNPEEWRNAVLGCRNLLSDLADHLWHDPRPTYEHLPGTDKDGKRTSKMSVSKGMSKNRLRAYLHQKGLCGTRGEFLSGEIERLADSVSALIAYQSTAHAPITRDDARSIALGTYFIIGEFVIRTDMQPIQQYGKPATDGQPEPQ